MLVRRRLEGTKPPPVDPPTHLCTCKQLLPKCGEAKGRRQLQAIPRHPKYFSPTNVVNLDKSLGKVRLISIFTCVVCPAGSAAQVAQRGVLQARKRASSFCFRQSDM